MGKEERDSYLGLNYYNLFGKQNISDVIDLDLSDEEDDVEKGEFSGSKSWRFVCKMCCKNKLSRDTFYISGCTHVYCTDCMAEYIHSQLEDNIINIRCPDFSCRFGRLEVGFCRPIIPTEDFKRWNKEVCEVLFNIEEKFYCPFVDCSALLIRTEAVKSLECPNCNRMLCGLCKVRWHEGSECSEFKKVMRNDKGKDVIMANIGKDTRWRQCPNCTAYVAKSEGCSIMRCRCPCRFCYTCGNIYSTGMCNCYRRNSTYLDQLSDYYVRRSSRISPKGRFFMD